MAECSAVQVSKVAEPLSVAVHCECLIGLTCDVYQSDVLTLFHFIVVYQS